MNKTPGKHKDRCVVGTNVGRVDAVDKVTGRALYAADYSLPGQLYGAVLYAEHPHAEIVSIDAGAAAKAPGNKAVLTYRDVPGELGFGTVIDHQQPLCSDKVRYLGDVIAITAADNRELAEKAARLVRVDYRVKETVADPEEALKSESPLVHEAGNLCNHHKVNKGDVELGFANSDIIIERIYETQKIEHAYLEPEAVLAVPGENGGVTITGSVQNLFNIRKAVAGFLALPLNRVRIIQATLGGSFGGKDETMSALCCRASLLAIKTGRPVKMVNTRENSMRESYKRHPYKMYYKVGIKKDGKIQAMETKIYADAGAYAAMSPFVTWRSVVHATGAYEIPHVRTDVYAAHTNNCYGSAMRGFGSPQICFASESLMDEIAEELGLDPLDIRMRNILKDGSVTATGQVLKHKVSVGEALQSVTRDFNFKKAWTENRNIDGSKTRGIGIACSYRGVSLGAEGVDAAGVVISLQTDGSMIVSTGLVDMGQGAATTIAMVVSEETGVTVDRIRFLNADTSRVPDSGPTVASRTTVMAGNAAIVGCTELKKRMTPVASDALGCAESDLIFENNTVYSGNDRSRKSLSLSDLASVCFRKGISLITHGWYKSPETTWNEESGQGDAYFTYVYGANLAEVEVDRITGRVRVIRCISSHDLGRTINPHGARGQVYGGVVMGLGYGLLEEYIENEGRAALGNFDEYLIPTMSDAPDMDVKFIENEDVIGPYGAKSLGEPACELAAPAIVNAVFNATGRRIRTLPLTLERVLLGKNLIRKDKRGSDPNRI